MRRLLSFAVLVSVSSAACRGDDPLLPPPKKKDEWYAKAVKKFETTVEPTEAKPGQTVTLTMTFDLADGYTTYPTTQPDRNADLQVNRITFPEPGAVVFVGDVIDSPKFKKKAEPDLSIDELRYYAGKAVYQRKFVVNPAQKPGDLTVTLPAFKLTVCNADVCYPTKTLKPEATVKVLPGPAVAVEQQYADEVAKALAGK